MALWKFVTTFHGSRHSTEQANTISWLIWLHTNHLQQFQNPIIYGWDTQKMPQNWRKSEETLLPLEDRRHLDEDLGRHVQCFEISTAGNHANHVAGSRLAKLLHSGFQVTYQEVHSVKFVERQGILNTTYHIISLLDAKLSCTNHKMLKKLHKFLTKALMRLISFFSAIMHYIMLLQRKLLHKNNTYIII